MPEVSVLLTVFDPRKTALHFVAKVIPLFGDIQMLNSPRARDYRQQTTPEDIKCTASVWG